MYICDTIFYLYFKLIVCHKVIKINTVYFTNNTIKNVSSILFNTGNDS